MAFFIFLESLQELCLDVFPNHQVILALLLAEFLDRCGDVAFVEVDDDAYLFYGRLDRFSITKIFFPDGVAKKCVDAKSGHTLEYGRTRGNRQHDQHQQNPGQAGLTGAVDRSDRCRQGFAKT